MKKFDNIFEQAREIIRQQWTLQDLRREAQCTGRPEAVRQQIAAARLRRMPWQGRTGQSGPAPPPSIPPGISRNTKRGLHHDHPQRCPGLLPHAGQSGL